MERYGSNWTFREFEKHLDYCLTNLVIISKSPTSRFNFFALIYSSGSLDMQNQVRFRRIGLNPEKLQRKYMVQTGLSANLEDVQITALPIQSLSQKAPRQVSIFLY